MTFRIVSILCLLWALGGCKEPVGTELPTTADQDIFFRPAPGLLELDSCEWFQFSTVHRSYADLRVRYWLDDQLVSDATVFVWNAPSPGTHVVRVEAHVDGDVELETATWTAKVSGPTCDDPPPHPQTVYFTPFERQLEIEPYAPYLFQAMHSQYLTVPVKFWLDDALVSERASFSWTPTVPGSHQIRAWAQTSDEATYEATWRITVLNDVSSPVPSIREVLLETVPKPRHLNVFWLAPPPTEVQVPLLEYLVYVSSHPITSIDSPDVQEYVFPHAGDEVYSYLEEVGPIETESLAHVQVVVRDVLYRISEPTPTRSIEVAQPFSLSGTVDALDLSARQWLPAGGIQVGWGDAMDVTGPDGRYELDFLSSYFDGELQLVDPSGILDDIVVLPSAETQTDLDFHLLPRVTRRLHLQDGLEHDVPLGQVLRVFTRTEPLLEGRSAPIYRWQDYPIAVQPSDFVYVGNQGETVEYRPAFEWAVETWNEAAGRRVLELQDGYPATGVFVTVDLLPISGLLGQTVITRPIGGNLFENPPVQMQIRLRKFNTAELARRIILHELGHVLLMGHSPDPDHVMHTIARQGEPTPLEGEVAGLLSILPQGFDMELYRP